LTPSVTSSGSGGASDGSQTAGGAKSSQVDKNMFLRLLVAQMRNQNPLNPSDGTEFVAQLAQFQQVEESLNMSQHIAAIRQSLDTLVAASTPTKEK
jgi:flagellar basal-body rod modification protein FlgD